MQETVHFQYHNICGGENRGQGFRRVRIIKPYESVDLPCSLFASEFSAVSTRQRNDLTIPFLLQVRKLVPGSTAGDDGRLMKDDKILSVNGKDLKGLKQGEALNMLKIFPHRINLTISRKKTEDITPEQRSVAFSAVDLRPPSPQLKAAMTPPQGDMFLPGSKSFSHAGYKAKTKRGAFANSASDAAELAIGGGRNSMYGDL